jgi:hypothetical protein
MSAREREIHGGEFDRLRWRDGIEMAGKTRRSSCMVSYYLAIQLNADGQRENGVAG